MATAEKSRKDKQVLVDIDNSVREISRQFAEQQRILDLRSENKVFLITDLQEFFKRRSELDMEYGKNLERLCERFTERFQKQRANYGLPKNNRASYVNLWAKLLVDARFKAKTATNLSEIYSKNIINRLTEIAEDVQRIAKSVRETHTTLQQEIMRLIMQLQTHMKSYYSKHSDFIFSETRYHASEVEMKKAEELQQKKANEKNIKKQEKILEKRTAKWNASREKSMRTRNDYILSVESVSSVLSKYFDYNLSEIINKYDHNFHNSFSSTLQAYIGAETRMASAQIQSANSLAHSVSIMDIDNDNKMVLEDNQIFMPMIKFSFVPHTDDPVQTITAEKNMEAELTAEHRKIFEELKLGQMELADLRSSMEKRKKGLESTYKKYDSEMNGFYHHDMSPLSGAMSSPTNSSAPCPPQQLKADKEEWENGLLTKFCEYIMSESVQLRLQAKYDILTKALGEITADPGRHNQKLSDRKRTIKLFGTSLQKQIEELGCEIPEIVESCAKYIAKYGLRHQGIFRVPGASQEIADMKLAFEKGRDPLSGLNHWKDINAVAGIFRLYFREMCEPLFPFHLNQDYLRASSISRLDDQIAEASSILHKIEPWNLHVIKYIIKFLNLIASHCEHNLMNSHNLAVVFGPTLFRILDNENLLTNQGQVNVFMDTLISEFYQIFPDEPIEGTFEDKVDGVSDFDEERTEDELDSEDDTDSVEAVALYNYTARTDKEVSFNKGDMIHVYSRTNKDWWDARVNGHFGFVPVSYVRELKRPSSVVSERKKSTDDESVKSLNRLQSLDSPVSPVADNRRKFSGDVGESHGANVFAALDPTLQSPSTARRVGNSPRLNAPSRSHSDKIRIQMPGMESGKILPHELQSSKLRSSSDTHMEGDDVEITTFPRRSFKDKGKLDRQAPLQSDQRPASGFVRQPVQGAIIKDVSPRDTVPSFKPPPPPMKPKPAVRKKDPSQDLAATIHAAAVAKAQRNVNEGEKDNNTHL